MEIRKWKSKKVKKEEMKIEKEKNEGTARSVLEKFLLHKLGKQKGETKKGK